MSQKSMGWAPGHAACIGRPCLTTENEQNTTEWITEVVNLPGIRARTRGRTLSTHPSQEQGLGLRVLTYCHMAIEILYTST